MLAPAMLDAQTLLFVAVLIAALLGALMILVWFQDRTLRALAWWGAAYFVGGAAIVMWGAPYPLLHIAPDYASTLIFVACGMVWNGVRLFQGRRPMPAVVFAGAILWLLFLQLEASDSIHSTVAGLLVAAYTFCIAFELWRERRKTRRSRVAAIVVPALHAAIFLVPIVMKAAMPAHADGWSQVFALETLLYAVGAGFVVLLMVKDRAVGIYKTAANTDHLTGLLNRRAFFENAAVLRACQQRKREPMTVFVFDLDHFKSINDRFGHAVGDDALRTFASCIQSSMRSEDVIGRLGGEEFVAVVPAGQAIAAKIAERVRACFQQAGAVVNGHALKATVSIGAASAAASDMDIEALIERADVALYRAKHAGRNRVEFADEVPADAAHTVAVERHLRRRATALFRAFVRRGTAA